MTIGVMRSYGRICDLTFVSISSRYFKAFVEAFLAAKFPAEREERPCVEASNILPFGPARYRMPIEPCTNST